MMCVLAMGLLVVLVGCNVGCAVMQGCNVVRVRAYATERKLPTFAVVEPGIITGRHQLARTIRYALRAHAVHRAEVGQQNANGHHLSLGREYGQNFLREGHAYTSV